MKRAALGGAHRGPVAPTRQQRTIRFIQLLLLAFAIGLFVFAGYSLGRSAGFEDGKRAGEIDAPADPSAARSVVLLVLGVISLGGAALLSDRGTVRIPTPARLDDLAGRAESIALEKAAEGSQLSQSAAETSSSSSERA